MQTVRQVEFALFDFRMHMEAKPMTGADIQNVLDQVRSEFAVNIPPAFTRFQHAFGHIWSGPYSAGYFSYKWAEVLAADGFSKFAENGVLSRATGEEFLHNVLEPGSSKPMMELFAAYRGREPSIDALLKYSGLTV
jgi:oligopeptidase A